VDGGPVGGQCHQPVEYVELAHEVAFANAANRRIARHLSNVLGAERQQADARATPGRGSRSLAPGMAGPDHQNVVHGCALVDPCFT
jgi:hypothetical protein